MPIIIPHDIPAYSTLYGENIFVMDHERAQSQDIRPIEIAIVNLMPTKIETETQLIRLLSNSPLQIKVTLIGTEQLDQDLPGGGAGGLGRGGGAAGQQHQRQRDAQKFFHGEPLPSIWMVSVYHVFLKTA